MTRIAEILSSFARIQSMSGSIQYQTGQLHDRFTPIQNRTREIQY